MTHEPAANARRRACAIAGVSEGTKHALSVVLLSPSILVEISAGIPTQSTSPHILHFTKRHQSNQVVLYKLRSSSVLKLFTNKLVDEYNGRCSAWVGFVGVRHLRLIPISADFRRIGRTCLAEDYLEPIGEVPTLTPTAIHIMAEVRYYYVLAMGDKKEEASIVFTGWQDAAKKALPLARSYAPNAEAKWGQEGLDSIFQDKSIHAVAVVLPAQYQLEIVLRALEAGKHVIQEKPVGPSVADVRKAWSAYQALAKKNLTLPIWAVAENYRFEPGLIQAGKFVKELGQIMGVQVLIEAPMNSSSPYFSSAWRRDASFKGGFMLDGGVHFIAGLRMIMGCEVASVSACVSHVDQTLPPSDNLSALIQLWNGSAGVVNICYSATTRKMFWRVLGSLGTVESERVVQNGQHGYKTTYQPIKGEPQIVFCPFAGVYEELKAFAKDVAKCVFQGRSGDEADKRSSVLEAMRDVAVIEAMLNSSDNKGTPCVVEVGLA